MNDLNFNKKENYFHEFPEKLLEPESKNVILNKKLNSSFGSVNNFENSENSDLAEKIYKSGKLLERHEHLNNLNLNLELDFRDLYNKQGKEIMRYLQPVLDKLKKKEVVLEELTSKAREYISEYKKNGEILNKTIEKYKIKKLKLNKLVENVGILRKEVKEKDKEILEKEKHLLVFEKDLTEKIEFHEKDKLKFNNFVEIKSKEILLQAENFKHENLNTKNLSSIFQQKEIELNDKINTLEKNDFELKNKLKIFESEKYDFDIQKRDFDLTKEEFDIYSQDVISKYEEIKNYKNNFDEQNKKLQHYEILLNEKHRNNIENEKKITLTLSDIEKKNMEFVKKQQTIDQKEKEIEEMKIMLQEKLDIYSKKVQEAEKVHERLKEKENILSFKSDIEKEIDLKLTGLDLNETLNKKKIAVQQKMLNDEISKRLSLNKLAKKIVKNGDNNKNNFSKIISIIKGNK